jgi:rhodanese-related sulfurtransferase
MSVGYGGLMTPLCRHRARGCRSGASFTVVLDARQNAAVNAVDASKAQAEREFLDVREDDEWQAGHIDGARHIPLRELSARVSELPKGRPIVAVCRSGSRSAAAVRGLKQLGYDAENLDGGVTAWSKAGLPLIDNAGNPGRVI